MARQIRKVSGIIVSRKKTGNSDYLATLLTESGALLSFLAHGLQKSARRSLQLVEPAAYITVDIYSDEGGRSSLKEGSIQTLYNKSRTYKASVLNAYLLEVAASSARGEEDNRIFDLLFGALTEMNNFQDEAGSRQHGALLAFYLIRMSAILGILGAPDACHGCGARLQARLFWNSLEGGFYCSKCDQRSCANDALAASFISLCLKKKFSAPEVQGAISKFTTENILNWHSKLSASLENYCSLQFKSGPQLQEVF